MKTVPQCSPTGNDLPFSVWTVEVDCNTRQPVKSAVAASFRHLLEALDYIAYLGERRVASVLRGMYGNVSPYPVAKARCLASERWAERQVLADASARHTQIGGAE